MSLGRIATSIAAIVAATLLAACGSFSAPQPRLAITADRALAPLNSGARVQLHASWMFSDRRAFPELKVTWIAENPQVATVSASGQLVALQHGITRIIAVSGTSRATAVAIVSPGRITAQNCLDPEVTAETSGDCLSGGGNTSTVSSGTGGGSAQPASPWWPDWTQQPFPDFVWRGSGAPGSSQGTWYSKESGERLHPDLNHPGPIGPHVDYTDPDGGQWRWFPDGRFEEK